MAIDLKIETEQEAADEVAEVAPDQRLWLLRYWRRGLTGLLVIGLVFLLALSMLGPQVGSVFSAVTKGLGGSPYTASTPGYAYPPGSTPPAANGQSESWDRKIIRNATLRIEVGNVEQTLAQLRTLATSEGGVVFKETTSQQDKDKLYGEIVLQVPGQSFESVINRIRLAAAKINFYESSSQDVTEEYVDLGSELTNLRRTEEGLQKLIDKAQKLEDVLALQRELGNVRGEIEKRQGRLNFLDKHSAYSNIAVTVSLPPAPEQPAAPAGTAWQPDQALTEAWAASLKVLGKLAIVAIKVVVFLWWLFPLLLAGFIWWRVRRKRDYIPQ